MQISEKGIDALKEHEGFRAEAYKDTGGVWTIGYGTTKANGMPVREGMICTRQEAEGWLVDSVGEASRFLNAQMIPLEQNQFDALVSFVYNVGVGAFNLSTMLRLLRQQKYIEAAQQFDRWVYVKDKLVKGLVARRRIERDMFEGHPQAT